MDSYYMKTLIDRGINLRVLRIVSRAIIAGLVAIGSIDHLPTIIAIIRIILVYVNVAMNIAQFAFTTTDVPLTDLNKLMCNAINESKSAFEYYEQIVSRD
jgi:hypothetical protein